VRQSLVVSLVHAQADSERAEADAAAWSKSLPGAAEAFLLLRARYFGGGGAKLLEVLDALNQSVDTRVAFVRALQDAGLAKATQAQLLGQSTP
jgi:outer membrane protein TolC